jgi:hypothetical protein
MFTGSTAQFTSKKLIFMAFITTLLREQCARKTHA